MNGRVVRVLLVAIDHNDPPIQIDVLIDNDNNVVSGRAIFGFQGVMNGPSKEAWPFILYEDGTLDYGTLLSDPTERWVKLYLHSTPVIKGQIVTLDGPAGSYQQAFRISNIEETFCGK